MKQKKRPVLDITGFFFRMSTQVKADVRKKKPVMSTTGKFFCFNNNVSNLWNNSVVEKINGMAFNPTTTLKLIYWFIYHQSIVHFYIPMYLWTWYILLIAIVKYNTVIYKNNVIIILSKLKKTHQFNNIYRVIVNQVRLYKNRSTVQGQTITGNTCNWMITMMTEALLMWKSISLVNLIYKVLSVMERLVI